MLLLAVVVWFILKFRQPRAAHSASAFPFAAIHSQRSCCANGHCRTHRPSLVCSLPCSRSLGRICQRSPYFCTSKTMERHLLNTNSSIQCLFATTICSYKTPITESVILIEDRTRHLHRQVKSHATSTSITDTDLMDPITSLTIALTVVVVVAAGVCVLTIRPSTWNMRKMQRVSSRSPEGREGDMA
jgi:hypothetical protein